MAVQADLDKASGSFRSSVEQLSSLLGTADANRILAAREEMQLWSEAVRTLSEQERVLQRRLTHVMTRELSLSAAKVTRSSSRAAWASFLVTLFALIAWTATVFVATVVPE